MGRWKKGESGNLQGRPKGHKNKFPSAIKEKILHACAYLESQGKDLATTAAEKPEWFYENFIKPMIPKEVYVDLAGALQITITKRKVETPDDEK